jgi:hypothetical protein
MFIAPERRRRVRQDHNTIALSRENHRFREGWINASPVSTRFTARSDRVTPRVSPFPLLGPDKSVASPPGLGRAIGARDVE